MSGGTGHGEQAANSGRQWCGQIGQPSFFSRGKLTELDKMLDKKSVLKAAAWSTAGSWISQIIGFAVFAVLSIFLGPKAYGLMAMAMAIVAISEILVVGGLVEALVQKERLERDHVDSVFWLLIGVAACLTVVIQACATPMAAIFDEPTVAELIRWLSVLPVLHALCAVPSALLMRDMRFDLLALRPAVGLSFSGVVGISMALSGFGVWSLVGHQLTQQIVIVIFLWLTSNWRPRLRISIRHLRELAGFGSQIIGIKLVALGEQQLVRTIIGASLGPVALGFFHMGWRLLETLQASLLLPLTNAAMPAFSRMQSDLGHARIALHKSTRFGTLIGFPSFFGLAAVAPDLIPYIFGEQWAGSVHVAQILALLGALWSVTYFYSAAMRGLGHPMMQLAPAVSGLVVLMVMLLAFAQYGIEVVALCILIRTLLFLPPIAYLGHRLTGLEAGRQCLTCLPALLSAVAMAAVVVGWHSVMTGTLSGAAMLASDILVGVAAYLSCMLALDRHIAREVLDLATTVVRGKPIARADS